MRQGRTTLRFQDISYAAALLALLAACGGGDPPSGPSDDVDAGDGGGSQCDVPAIFANTCGKASGCHSSENPAGGLDLISAGVESRVTLVDGSSCFGVYADPSDPVASLLYDKVSDSPSCGVRMPLGLPALTKEEQNCIRDWISGLSPPDPEEDSGTPPPDDSGTGEDDAGMTCEGCDCQPGDTEPCYDHLPETVGVGLCAQGTRTCQNTGLWGFCENQVLPSVENCNTPADDDCNGLTPACSNFWSIGYGVLRNQSTESVGVDADGNIYALVSFEGTQDFGGGPLVAPGVDDDNENNVALVKYDATGTHVWSHAWGDTSNQLAARLVVNGTGDSALLIRSRGSINLGGDKLTTIGDSDIVVAKFDKDGNHVWSRIFGGGNLDRAERIAFDNNGNVIVAGKFTGSVSFPGSGSLASGGITDGLLMKLASADGEIVFKMKLGGAGDDDYAFGVDTDADGNVFVGGHFSTAITLGLNSFTSAGGTDAYLAKLDPDGNFLWSKAFGGAGNDTVQDLAIEQSSGDVVVTGYFRGTVNFGGTDLVSAGESDIFVARFDGAGTHTWSLRFGDAAEQDSTGTLYTASSWLSLALSAAGNIYIAGPLFGTVDWNAASPGGTGVISAAGTTGTSDAFWVKLKHNGTFSKVAGYGKTGTEMAQDIAVTGAGDVVLAGRYFGSGVDFGGGIKVKGLSGDSEGFMAKIHVP